MKQFIVTEGNKDKRAIFYDYIMDTYKLKLGYPLNKEGFVNSKFPFVVDFKRKNFWICDSITCCAAASSNGQIISIDDFFNEIKKDKRL